MRPPVVADEVDRLVDPVELAEQPVDVVVLRGAEARRSRVAEAGQREGDGLGGRCAGGCRPRWRPSRGPRGRRRSRRGRYPDDQTASVAPISTRCARAHPPRPPAPAGSHRLRLPLAMVEHLVGMQAQEPRDPYLALWSRLDGFEPADLEAALLDRSLVRMVAMRGTIHLLTRRRRAGPAPALPAGPRRGDGPPLPAQGARSPGVDLRARERVRARAARRADSRSPSLRAALAERFPEHDPAALAFACRNTVPLVQAPPRGLWARTRRRQPTWRPSTGSAEPAPRPRSTSAALRYLAGVRAGHRRRLRDVDPAHPTT